MQPSLKMPFTSYTPDTANIYNDGEATAQNCLPYLQSPNYSQSLGLSLTAIGQPNSGAYSANAARFSNQPYMTIASNLAGIINTKTGTLSLWIRIDGNTGNEEEIIEISGASIPLRVGWNNVGHLLNFRITGQNSAGTTILDISTTANYNVGTTWYNLLASWNLGTAAANLYVNNTSDLTSTILTNDTLNYATSAGVCTIGKSVPLGRLLFASLAEVWFDTSFLDLSSSGNRAKFISSGLPVNLGTTGQTPTGSSPLLYLKSQASQFNVNSGTGGNFTITNGPLAIASSSPSGATPSQYSGSISVIDSGNSPHTYAGNTSQLVEITATTANNVSKSGGYTNTTFWKFAQYGNNVYATDYADAIQTMAVGGTAFADLTGGPPKAKCIAQIGQFVIVGNTNGGTYGGGTAGACPNRVWWPQINTPTNWPDPLLQASIGQQAGVQDLPEIYGEVRHISNGQLWGLVFQEHAISNFYYIGGNVVFQVNTYEKQRGLYCPNGACQIGSLVYFIDASGFFVTDGATVQPIGHDFVDKTWLADVNTAYLDHVRASHDVQNKCIWWSYVSNTATLQGSFVSCDKVIVYNYADKRWAMGYVGQTIDMIFDAHTLGYTMEQLDSINSNLDIITPSLDSPFWNGGLPIVGAFGISQIGTSGSYASYYGTFTGAALTATLQTKTVNLNQGGRAFVTAVKPIVMGATPSGITVQLGQQTLPTDAITYTAGTTPETRTGKCSVRSDAVFHNAKVTISGGFTNALGVEPEFKPSGWA